MGTRAGSEGVEVRHLSLKALAASVALLPAFGANAAIEHFSVVAANEKVGTLDATVDRDTVSIAYQVRNNGRGPTLSEHISLSSDRVPAHWKIEGTTAFGGKVAERFDATQSD